MKIELVDNSEVEAILTKKIGDTSEIIALAKSSPSGKSIKIHCPGNSARLAKRLYQYNWLNRSGVIVRTRSPYVWVTKEINENIGRA